MTMRVVGGCRTQLVGKGGGVIGGLTARSLRFSWMGPTCHCTYVGLTTAAGTGHRRPRDSCMWLRFEDVLFFVVKHKSVCIACMESTSL